MKFAYVENLGYQMFIDGEDSNLQYGHDEELHRAGFTQDSPKGDQDCRRAEVCVYYSAGKKSHKSATGHIFILLLQEAVTCGEVRHT